MMKRSVSYPPSVAIWTALIFALAVIAPQMADVVSFQSVRLVFDGEHNNFIANVIEIIANKKLQLDAFARLRKKILLTDILMRFFTFVSLFMVSASFIFSLIRYFHLR
jgi:hypothetical protein